MTVLPRRLLAKFLKGELSEAEAEEHDLDVTDPTSPAQIRLLLEVYSNEGAEFTEQDREDLKEALMVAVDRGLGDIASAIVYALTGPLFEALPQPRGAAPQPRVQAEADATDPEQRPDEENPSAPTGGRRRKTRRSKTSRRKTKSRRV